MWNTIIFSLIYYRCCQDVNVYANKSKFEYRDKFTPFYFCPFPPCCQWANLETGLIPISQITSFHTTLGGQIQDGAEQFASVEGRK